MTEVRLGAAGRAALRAAVREALRNAGRADECAGVSDLSRDNLIHAARSLGLDPAAIADVANAAQPAPAAGEAEGDAPASPVAPVVLPAAGPDVTETTDETIKHGPAPDPEAVDETVRAVMAPLGQGDAAAFRDQLTGIVRRALAGPATVIRTVTRVERVEVPVASLAPLASGALPYAVQTGAVRCGDLFGDNAARWEADTRVALWDAHGAAPAVDADFHWSGKTLPHVLSAWAERRPVWVWGPAGGGKTSMIQQLAARLGRPYVRISCTATTEAAELVGMTVPAAGGGTKWQDGQLTAAIRRPGTVILVDEPSVARAGALFVLQAVLDSGELHVAETGEVVRVAPGIVWAFCDNTNGTGDASGQYEDTGRVNRATLDRMFCTVLVDYLPAKDEAAVLAAKARVPLALARLLVDFATATRRAAGAALTEGLGLRRLLALAALLRRGAPLSEAWETTIAEGQPAANREHLNQLRKTLLTDEAVAAALSGGPAPAKRSARGDAAAADFRGA
ncbi:CobS subunit of cobaltochelatase [Microcystis phage Mae-Yong1326-1]|nr:CobS subunit of cobaltochelatase [Microcystis phage Mae-Yong1326-1]